MSNTNNVLLGQAEFFFARGSTTAAAARVAGYKRFRDITASKITNSANYIEHKSCTRGVITKDLRYPSETTIGYELTHDEFDKEAMKTIFMGSDTTALTQSSGTSQTSDAWAFNTTASDPGKWYPVLKSGVPIREITALTIATKTEGTDFEVDYKLGLVRFITAFSASTTCTYTCSAITSADASYMYGITPLTNVTQSGMGCMRWWDNNSTNKLRIDHVDFSCQVSLSSMNSATGDKFIDYTVNVVITSIPGTVLTTTSLS